VTLGSGAAAAAGLRRRLTGVGAARDEAELTWHVAAARALLSALLPELLWAAALVPALRACRPPQDKRRIAPAEVASEALCCARCAALLLAAAWKVLVWRM
jgi:hypothetical protein